MVARRTLLLCVLVFVGCAPTPKREIPATPPAKTPPAVVGADSVSDVEERARRWLRQNSYVLVYLHQDELDPNFRTMDADQWIAEGRRIPNIELGLRELLRKNDPGVELPQVAFALGELGTADSVPVLIDAITRQAPVMYLRLEAASALGKLRDARAVRPLGELLETERNESVRGTIVGALATIGGHDAVMYLRTAANDKSDFVSRLAKEALMERAGKGQKR